MEGIAASAADNSFMQAKGWSELTLLLQKRVKIRAASDEKHAMLLADTVMDGIVDYGLCDEERNTRTDSSALHSSPLGPSSESNAAAAAAVWWRRCHSSAAGSLQFCRAR
nr:uncharacterized protein LOC109150384 [Ipomoea batatas]